MDGQRAPCPPPGVVVASGHVSDPVARESTRRRLTAKQAATVDRLEALVALQAAANQQLIAQLQAMTQAQLDSAAMGDLVPHSTSDGM